ncbi:MAG TPA: fluoride efflux transporter CrcB [Candidatus Anammoximicrobium sp.]|nr:fluoride efflux transporter CrcB [Candidatus Anammoximicrobium sp.]
MHKSLELIGPWLYAILTNKFVALTLGGALGTNARYWLSRWLNELAWGRGFPLGTLAVNVTGSFVLGLAAILILERLPPSQQAWYLLIGTGFCGGYTTFSTFEWETFKLVRDGNFSFAVLNALGSVLAGFAGVVLAVALMEMVLPKRW